MNRNVGGLARFFAGLHNSDPAKHGSRGPATREKQIEVQQAIEIRRVFKAASLMITELNAACLNMLDVAECTVDCNGRDNQCDLKADFFIHRLSKPIGGYSDLTCRGNTLAIDMTLRFLATLSPLCE
ncbi:hypothetical protein [Paraburkholderia caffeinilytica]|uniref:hypothetical protein n=1 Tax=Paraburkholderia caffeinilytica TaxID=1761016 RepID=UPI0038BC7D17